MVPDDLKIAVLDLAETDGYITEDHWLLIDGTKRYVFLSDELKQSNVRIGRASTYRGVRVITCDNKESDEFLNAAEKAVKSPSCLSHAPCRIVASA